MQYKKESVREKILEAARKEYRRKGFRGGNISTIAENAGVPVGNLYRYFQGKTGVLDAIVKPAYDALPKLMAELEQVEILYSATLSQAMPVLSGGLLRFFDTFGEDILILVDCCAGTRYEDFFSELTGRVSRIIGHKLYPASKDPQEKITADIVSKAFCTSLFDVLRMGLSHDEKQAVVERLLKFYFYEIDKRK